MWEHEGGVGSHWGYLYSNRTGKHKLQSVLIPGDEVLNKKIFLPLVEHSTSLAQITVNSLSRYFSGLNPLIGKQKPDVLLPDDQEFWIFQNYVNDDNHFIPSGWMGDQGDLTFYECEPAGLNGR